MTGNTMAEQTRKFAAGRYRKSNGFCLDFDGSKYINTFNVLDGDKETGISVGDSGDSHVDGSNKRTITFKGQEYALLRDAIFAYEDSLVGAGAEGRRLERRELRLFVQHR
jgi:hypothetical protein